MNPYDIAVPIGCDAANKSAEIIGSHFPETKMIHINFGRATGKTSHIMKNANKNDLIICHNNLLANMFRKHYPSKFKTNVISIDTNFSDIHINNIRNIYVDEPYLCFLSPGNYAKFWNFVKKCRYTGNIIMLGE